MNYVSRDTVISFVEKKAPSSNYRIVQNGGRGKLWKIWQNKRNSPIFYPAKLQIQ